MKKSETTDTKRLITRIVSGDQHAFQTLIEKYQRLVSHIVFRMIPNASDGKDICQDVFMKVYQNIGNFRHESKLSTWIATIAHNTCLNYLQKKKIPLFEDHTSNEITIDDVSGDQIFPDMVTESRDLSRRLHREIQELDVKYRTILTLYHLDEMSYAEIGKVMNLPPGTVKSYLFRARKQLKDRLLMQYQRDAL